VRILKALDVRPRRTIRIALWSGEEQGLYGSEAYVMQHFASRPIPTDPTERENFSLRRSTGPLSRKPDYAKLSAYFNLDNGTGKIRGIYAQENAAVVPIYQKWLEPLKDLGATTVTMRNTRGTDHESFDAVGLPAFQFVQDEVEYETRTHHTNQDVYERLQADDLIQASVVLATFVWQAAERDERLPRKPMPRVETKTGPTPASPRPSPPSSGPWSVPWAAPCTVPAAASAPASAAASVTAAPLPLWCQAPASARWGLRDGSYRNTRPESRPAGTERDLFRILVPFRLSVHFRSGPGRDLSVDPIHRSLSRGSGHGRG